MGRPSLPFRFEWGISRVAVLSADRVLPLSLGGFPAWVSLLGEFGYKVDIACPDTPGHLETLAMLGIERLPVEHLWDIPFERYDLVVIGTLMHMGYNHLECSGRFPGSTWSKGSVDRRSAWSTTPCNGTRDARR